MRAFSALLAGPRPRPTGVVGLPLWRGYRSWAGVAGILIATAAFCALVQGHLWEQSPTLAGANLACSLLFVFTGLMLLREPGQRRVAFALMAAGIFRSLDFISSWNWPALEVYGLIFGAVDRLFGAYALLRYPNPSLLRHQRIYLILLTIWMLVGRTAIAVTSNAQMNGDNPASWWPGLWPNQQLSDVINVVVNAGEGCFGVALVVLLVLRLVRTRGLDRIVIAPIILAGIAGVFAASASAISQMVVSLSTAPNNAYGIESAVDLTIPLAFLVAVIQRALLLRNITTLTSQLSADADVGAVRYALRSALRDPTLDVIDLPPAGPAGTDEPDSGAVRRAVVATLPEQSQDRLVEFVRPAGGSPIAVVIADPALARYRGLFDAAVQTSGLALKNAQLQAQAARDKLEEVRASRVRIIEAGLAERRRIERDLHDGVQQHLLGVAARLAAAMTSTSDPQAAAAFGEATGGLREVLAELRDLAHGIHPAVLSQGGLAAALEEVAERLPLPVRVAGPASRAAPAIEATAYFVACEALTNVVKHAGASSATVTIHIDGSELAMEIADDGVGGVGPGAGQGLANIEDRINAVDGDVTIVSPPGHGTRVLVRIPCA
jgi:signal transduction histidine kinase